jgi:hypothetical protein
MGLSRKAVLPTAGRLFFFNIHKEDFSSRMRNKKYKVKVIE